MIEVPGEGQVSDGSGAACEDAGRSPASRRVSGRRVAFVVAVCGAALFVVGLGADLVRASEYRPFFVTSDVSVILLFAAAAAYLRWGDAAVASVWGRLAGRLVQVWAVLALVSQALVWVRVSLRGGVWWALLFVVPMALSAILALAAVNDALERRRAAGRPAPENGRNDARDAAPGGRTGP